jgi:hypothetical protein
MRGRAGLTATVATAAALTFAGTAGAATATVGSPLSANFIATGMGAMGDVTWAQTALPGASTASPTDGTIVSWQNRTLGGPFRLVVIRPVGSQFTNAGSSDLYKPANFAASPVIPTSLPVKAGDLIGIETTTGNGFDATGIATTPGASAVAWTFPHLQPGPPRTPDPLVANSELALRATVRYCAVPSLRGKKLAAARAALAAADCTFGKAKKPKKKSLRKKAKFVKSLSVAPGTSISDTAPIDLRLGKKPGKKK